MNRQWSSLGLFVVLAMVGVGCGDDDRGGPDMAIIRVDGGPDSGSSDGGPDMGPPRDAGMVRACAVGRACLPERGCNPATLSCQEELGFTQGMREPIYLPDGGTTMFPGVYFQDGYCTNATWSNGTSREGMAGACDPTPADDAPGMDGCPPCAKCVNFGDDGTGLNIVQCLERCSPSAAGNPCREGYTCDFGSQTCIFGCQSDAECQLYREDTNGDGTLDNEGPDGGVSPDRLRLDVAGASTCNMATGRCTQPGAAGATAGDTCVLDSECEMDGRCLSDLSYDGWTDGYCTKFGCDVLGCAGAGKCLDVGGGTNICTSPCKIADDTGDSAMGAGAGDDDCRDGYACFWDGLSTSSVAVNGGCLPGNYNDVTVENIGAACNDPDGPTGDRTSDEECWSPYGLGRCIFDDTVAACTILGCSMLPTGSCGVGNECADLGGGTSACLRSCTTPAQCTADMGRPSFGCVDLLGMPTAKKCWPGCLMTADCDTGYRCDGATATALGECVLM